MSKNLTIIAWPNGAAKTTFARPFLQKEAQCQFKFDAMVKRRYTNTDRSRSLLESAVSPAMFKALADWVSVNDEGVLIGSMALAYYARPRYTEDAEFLFRELPRLAPDGFKKMSDHRFERRSADVFFNIYDGAHINISEAWLDKIFKTSAVSNGIKICSPIALVVLKLARFNRQDQADIESTVKQEKILLRDFDDWNLSDELIAKMQMFYS